MMKCANCGRSLDASSTLCIYCGAAVGAAEAAAADARDGASRLAGEASAVRNAAAVAEKPEGAAVCPRCGMDTSAGGAFCAYCGSRFRDGSFKKRPGAYSVASVCACVLMILSLFASWVYIPEINSVASFLDENARVVSSSIPGLFASFIKLLTSLVRQLVPMSFRDAGELAGYLFGPDLAGVSISLLTVLAVFVVWLLALIFFCKNIYSVLSPDTVSEKRGRKYARSLRAGLNCVVILVVFSFLIIPVIAGLVSEGFTAIGQIGLNRLVYFIGAFAVIARVFLPRRVEDELRSRRSESGSE